MEIFNRPVRHQTKHHIRTKGTPVAQKIRRLSPEKREILKKQIQRMLKLGVFIPAESPYGAPVPMVAKKQPGEYRITGGFRLLNKQTVADKYSIPLLTDFIGQLSGCQIFSSIDLFKSYHQIEIAAEDIHKTAMITPVGNYAYKRLPMGLRSAGSTF